jgi:GNAT superfamily N-acetyltransferase
VIEIVNLVERPDLVPLTARWTWEEWGSSAGLSLEAAIAMRTPGPDGFEKCFVLLDDGEPAAMASLARQDMDERPDLLPWLAGVYVDTPFRGRGHGVRVVRRVEQAALEAGVTTLWLYSNTAEGLYRKLGWLDHEVVHRPGKKATLVMRRDLGGENGASPSGQAARTPSMNERNSALRTSA